MDILKNVIDELTSIRDELKYDRITVDTALKKMGECREVVSKFKDKTVTGSNILNDFFVTFNISNLAEATLLIRYVNENYSIIEAAGSPDYLEYITTLLSSDMYFYKNTDSFERHGINIKIYYEKMVTEKASYTILTVTESVFFMPSRFHMLSDILMDIIRSVDVPVRALYNDLFEDIVIDINRLLLSDKETVRSLFLFKFEYIPVFIENIGIYSILELSDIIMKKLNELFRDEAVIFRISLSRFLIFFTENSSGYETFVTYQKKGKLDFVYRGIVLPHHHMEIPFINGQTIYDIFENIYNSESSIYHSDVAI